MSITYNIFDVIRNIDFNLILDIFLHLKLLMNLGYVNILLKAKPHSYIYMQVTEHLFNTFLVYIYTIEMLYLIHFKWTFG